MKKYIDAEAIILTMDLGQRVDRRGWHYDVELRGAGRNASGTLRTWHTPGILTEAQLDDISAYVASQVRRAINVWLFVDGKREQSSDGQP